METVRDQLRAFERMMPYYVNTELAKQKSEAYEKIFAVKKAENDSKTQLYLAIGSIILTAIFGLPSLYETVFLIRSLIFPQIDIPIFSVLLISVVAWGIILGVLIIFLVRICVKSRKIGR